MIPVGMMMASEVPTATCWTTSESNPIHSSAVLKAGTITAPPPMPSKPAATPETTPVASIASTNGQ